MKVLVLVAEMDEFDEGTWPVYEEVEITVDPRAALKGQVADGLMEYANGLKGMNDEQHRIAHHAREVFVVSDRFSMDDLLPDRAEKWRHENREAIAANKKWAAKIRGRP